jgi:hypothetical protein
MCGHFPKTPDALDANMDIHICTTCNESKPRADFTRLATLAQTRAWLRNPNAQRRLTYHGAECNACFNKTKRAPLDMSPSEYARRLKNEGKDPQHIATHVANRVASGKKRASAAGIKGIQARQAPVYKVMCDALNELVEKLRQRFNYMQRTHGDPGALRFLDFALAQAILARRAIKDKYRKGGFMPDSWQEYVTDDAREELHKLFGTIDPLLRSRFDTILIEFEYQLTNPSSKQVKDIVDQWAEAKGALTPDDMPRRPPEEPKPEPPAWMLF